MNKKLIYSISIVLLLSIAIIGGTYSFFAAITDNKNITTNASKFEVIYTGGTEIKGPIELSEDRNGGINTTVHIKVGEGSSHALAYLYLNIVEMTDNLSAPNVKWEVSGIQKGNEVYTNSGTFSGYNATNNKIPLVEDYRLTEDQTDFTIYVWIDGNITGNEILGATFTGFISANTEQFTGELDATG